MTIEKIESFLIKHGMEYEIIDDEICVYSENPDNHLYITEDGMGWNYNNEMGIISRIEVEKDLNKIGKIYFS